MATTNSVLDNKLPGHPDRRRRAHISLSLGRTPAGIAALNGCGSQPSELAAELARLDTAATACDLDGASTIVEGLREQAPGGRAFAPLAPDDAGNPPVPW